MWSGLCQPSHSSHSTCSWCCKYTGFLSSLNSFLPAPSHLPFPLHSFMWLARSIPSLSNLLYCHLLRTSDYSFQSSAPKGIPLIFFIFLFVPVIALVHCTVKIPLFKLLFYCQSPHNESYTPTGRPCCCVHC